MLRRCLARTISVFWFVSFLLAMKVHALEEKFVQQALVGQWQLLSYELKGQEAVNYVQQDLIWHFSAEGIAVINDQTLGQFKDRYKVVKSKYAWMMEDDIIILIDALEARGFDHNKFIVRELILDQELVLGNWSDTVIYRLRRVKNHE